MILITLPLPPSSNKRVRPGTNPKTGKPTLFSTKKDAAYFETVRRTFAMVLGKPELITGPLRFHLDVWVPAYNYDSTNRVKTLEDAFENLAYVNDFQTISHRIERWLHGVHPRGLLGDAPPAPGVVVGIEELSIDDRTQPWLDRFPETRAPEVIPGKASVIRSDVELATTAKQWQARGLVSSGVVRNR